jgi:DNA modification methylase
MLAEDALGDMPQAGAGGDEFDAEKEEIPERCEPGDLWALGEHRLLVGDCTDAKEVARLFDGLKASAVVTSPPYTDQREYKIGEFNWKDLMCGSFDQMIANAAKDCHILVNLGLSHKNRRVDMYWNSWLDHAANKQWPLFGWYIWDKGSGAPGEWNGRLAPAHEFVFHFNQECTSANKWIETTGRQLEDAEAGRFRQKDGTLRSITSPDKVGQALKVPDSVIRVYREMARGIHTQNHPAVFPVAFPEYLINTWSQPGQIIYEPFCGSGTTIIAAERTGRRCFGCELEPKYADVCLERFIAETGETAKLLERVEQPELAALEV